MGLPDFIPPPGSLIIGIPVRAFIRKEPRRCLVEEYRESSVIGRGYLVRDLTTNECWHVNATRLEELNPDAPRWPEIPGRS